MRESGRLAFCAGVAAKVARFSLTICQGGRSAGKSGQRRRLAPDLGREFIARTVDEPVGVADRDREPVRKGEQPFDLSVDDAEDRRLAARRRDLEMDIENAAKFVRRRQARKEVLRDPWRHAEDHGIVRAELLLRPVKVERNGALALETDRPEAVAEPNRRALARRERQAPDR